MLKTNTYLKLLAGVAIVTVCAAAPPAEGQSSGTLDGYSFKIFKVESGLYPFVQVYFRTFDQDMRPLVNLNERNVGIMVKGRSYDMGKRQYGIQSLEVRDEAVRTVFVIDCSKTMAGKPFEAALEAAARFVDAKRPQDQVAIIAVRDTDDGKGYELVSNFEQDYAALGRRLADLQADGQTTRLYDALGAALQMSGMVSQGNRGSGGQYIVSSSIIVFSDGKDEGSALTRDNLMTRISNLPVPIPIYSLAYSRIGTEYLKNLEALSKNSFGIYFPIEESMERITRSVEEIQHILKNDYVLTFRSYLPIDGESHALKLGVEYPSNSGRMMYQNAEFEAIEPPPMEAVLKQQQAIAKQLPKLEDNDPYLSNPHTQGLAQQ